MQENSPNDPRDDDPRTAQKVDPKTGRSDDPRVEPRIVDTPETPKRDGS
jgi:hypothetical protein